MGRFSLGMKMRNVWFREAGNEARAGSAMRCSTSVRASLLNMLSKIGTDIS